MCGFNINVYLQFYLWTNNRTSFHFYVQSENGIIYSFLNTYFYKEISTSFLGFQLMPEVTPCVRLGRCPRATGLPLPAS